MRLHVPDHLQRDFHALMNLLYDLKKKNANLKWNVKFDEEELSLFMDVRLKENGDWKRIKPSQAMSVNKGRKKDITRGIDIEELRDLLGEDED